MLLALLGGTVASQIHVAAVKHLATDPKLVALNQPDVLSLHIEFLRVCERQDSVITVTTLKTGPVACTLQLHVTQKDKLRAVALATSTNFARSLGPSAPTAWSLHPPPRPKPNFDLVLARKPDENWIPFSIQGEVYALTGRMFSLNPRGGFPTDGVCDAWSGYKDGERLHATQIVLMTDLLPSLSDTLLRNGGLYDAHAMFKKTEQAAQDKPGEFAHITNSVAEVMKAQIFNSTVTLDIEFKRALPKDGHRMVFVRTATKMMHQGRMGVDVTICDENMDLICTAHQLIFILDVQRKVAKPKGKQGGNNKPKASL